MAKNYLKIGLKYAGAAQKSFKRGAEEYAKANKRKKGKSKGYRHAPKVSYASAIGRAFFR